MTITLSVAPDALEQTDIMGYQPPISSDLVAEHAHAARPSGASSGDSVRRARSARPQGAAASDAEDRSRGRGSGRRQVWGRGTGKGRRTGSTAAEHASVDASSAIAGTVDTGSS